MSDCRIRIAGYRLKDGKLVPDVRRLSVSQRLRQARSTTVPALGRAQVREMPTVCLVSPQSTDWLAAAPKTPALCNGVLMEGWAKCASRP